MLDKLAVKFISEQMRINIDALYQRLNEQDMSAYKEAIVKSLYYYINAIKVQQARGFKNTPLTFSDSPAENAINQYYLEHFNSVEDDEVKGVTDSLRHAFCSFAYGGLHQLFTCQENEVWYPQVLLDSELLPNDISELPELILLYRGTDRQEYETENYGQSWTTSYQVASDFAYKHYQSQPWFNENKRLILTTTYPKEGVYFSDQQCEFEVVIDTSKIGSVRIFT